MAVSKSKFHRLNSPAVPFSFRIGLWPIGSRRLVDDEETNLCLDKRCAGPHGAGRISFGREYRPPAPLGQAGCRRRWDPYWMADPPCNTEVACNAAWWSAPT